MINIPHVLDVIVQVVKLDCECAIVAIRFIADQITISSLSAKSVVMAYGP
jgi:hypothetical protein